MSSEDGVAIEIIPRRGIFNIGNTCFLNASLQLLAESCSDLAAGETLSSITKDIFAKLLTSGDALKDDVTRLKDAIKERAPHFTNGHQQDAHEFILFCLDKLELNNKKPLSCKFQGSLTSSTTCSGCHREPRQTEAFVALSLPLPVITTESFIVTLHHPTQRPQRTCLTLQKGVPLAALRAACGDLLGVSSRSVYLIEVAMGKFRTLYATDNEPAIAVVGSNDDVHAYIVEQEGIKLVVVPGPSDAPPPPPPVPAPPGAASGPPPPGPPPPSGAKTPVRKDPAQKVVFRRLIEGTWTAFGMPEIITLPIAQPITGATIYTALCRLLPCSLSSGWTCTVLNAQGKPVGAPIVATDAVIALTAAQILAIDCELWSDDAVTLIEAPVVDSSVALNDQSKDATLGVCLENYMAAEELDGVNMLLCDNCGKQPGVKRLSLDSLPPSLLLHFIRFPRAWNDKIERGVVYPERLMLSATTTGERSYSLQAVIIHSTESGVPHYTARVRWKGEWLLCDDQHVTRVPHGTDPNAYLLLYTAE